MWYEKAIGGIYAICTLRTGIAFSYRSFLLRCIMKNLKGKIQNAMMYFQSHVGYCYFPTKTGHMHKAFIGREDAMKRLVELCREGGISVTELL